ncbi:hypothetical protein FISHEDRAFT_61696 [Fistulina hepatica ATCC 64428]|uniref:Mitochondrial adapter protein MCP1 transmembrane domain-containing protein n=1 Tax=Fistulina hepatica ATCC 64428 TaxID=1128425 RepID=A0A0D7A1E9_9AGAR|nr:hypothetical protein FISHEDRAFT_61696 [Fistulina hepatica ATCC 64428]
MAPDKPKSFRQKAAGIAALVAHASAPFITVFSIVHLSAPISATFGGSSAASQMMLMGREYYQTNVGEKLLVLAPIILHSAASIARRLLSPVPVRSLSSVLTLTGYAVMGLFLPVHYLTHRVFPSLPEAPISSVGPAELDFGFVKFALDRWPLRSTLLYAGLVLGLALHAAEGGNVIWHMRLKRFAGKWASMWPSTSTRRLAYLLGFGAPVLTGLFYLAREPYFLSPFIAERYEAAFRMVPIYRF